MTKSLCIPYLAFPIAVILLLTACGSSNSGSRNNFGSDNRGENIDENADVRRVGVVVEATQQMLNTSRRPGEASIIEADISCNAINVVQLIPGNTSPPYFNASVVSGLPNFNVTSRTSPTKLSAGDGCQIEFDEEFNPRVNTAVRVELPNSEVLYAPLRIVNSENESIYVSFGSQLTLENFYSKINSPSDLDEALPCSASNPDCETQYRAKTRLLSFMAETARLYEYYDVIDASDNAETALEKLRQEPDITLHIDTATDEILRETSPIAKGTVRADYNIIDNPDLADGILQSRLQPSEVFNSVFFAMSLGEPSPDENTPGDPSISISISSSRLSEGDESSTQSYPRMIHNAYFLNYRYDDILPNIPYESNSYRLSGNGTIDKSEFENRYSYLAGISQADDASQQSPTNGTHLSSEGFFLNDRALNQTITDTPTRNGDRGIGFDYNPVYYKLFRVNDYEPDTSLTNLDTETPDYGASPPWVTGAGYGVANIYEIEQIDDDPVQYERKNIDEIRNMFTFEVHGITTESSIRDSDLSNRYNVIELSLKLDERTANPPITVTAETLNWQLSGNRFQEIQGANAHLRTRTLIRNRANNNITPTSDEIRSPLLSRSFSFVNAESGERNGLMFLDGGTNKKLGHMSPNGGHLAFALDDTSSNGTATRGIIIASETLSSAPDFDVGESYTYLLSGNYVAMDTQVNTMGNINGSQLIITGVANSNSEDCSAELEVNTLSLNHDITNKNIEDAATKTNDPISSASCTINKGEIELTFTLDGNPLILRGFATAEDNDSPYPSKLINLLWLQDQQVGLVFAQLDQNLSPTFE